LSADNDGPLGADADMHPTLSTTVTPAKSMARLVDILLAGVGCQPTVSVAKMTPALSADNNGLCGAALNSSIQPTIFTNSATVFLHPLRMLFYPAFVCLSVSNFM